MLGLQDAKCCPEQRVEHIECSIDLIATKVSMGEFVVYCTVVLMLEVLLQYYYHAD